MKTKVNILSRSLCAVVLFSLQFLVCNPVQAQELTLDSCLALARRNNIEIRTSQMEIEKAREVKRQVFTKYFPQVNLSGLGYYSANPLIHFSLEDIQSNDMRVVLQNLYDQLKGRELGEELLLSKNMLRAEGDLFLCGETPDGLSEKLGVPLKFNENDGADFLFSLLGE